MFLSTIKLRVSTWIAIWAILGGALAPSILMAKTKDHDNQIVMELCSTVNVGQTIMIDLDQSQAKSKMEHCPFCLLHTTFALVRQSNLSFKKPEISQFFPKLFYQSPKPLFAWIKLPSQAPPKSI